MFLEVIIFLLCMYFNLIWSDIFLLLPRQLPHTGGDAAMTLKRDGPTTQDYQGEPKVSIFVQTPGVLG